MSLFLVNRIYKIWSPNEYQGFSQAGKKNQTNFSEPKLSVAKKLPRKGYQDIVDKDLFRPERTEWRISAQPEQGIDVAKTTPKINIYGIVISNNYKYAWIKEEGKKEKIKKISEGESISDWKVSAIEPNCVSLTRGDETVKCNLIEPGKPKKRTIPKALTLKKPTKKFFKPGGKKGQKIKNKR